MSIASLLPAPVFAEGIGAPDCTDLFNAARAARKARSVGQAVRAFEAAREPRRGCAAFTREMIGRMVAHALYARAFDNDTPEAARARLLEKALHYGRPWRALASFGDVQMVKRDYARAARLYQQALDDMRDVRRNPKAPPVATIRAIHKKAEMAMLLANRIVTVTNRAGELGGLLDMRGIRGFEVSSVALPVTFQYDSTAFTDGGRHAAKLLHAMLDRRKSPDVTLIGHTDPRGSEAYNLRLSRRRAEAVGKWLTDQGYGGRVRTEGRGEDEPYEPDDPGRYSSEEKYQMDRRVVLSVK